MLWPQYSILAQVLCRIAATTLRELYTDPLRALAPTRSYLSPALPIHPKNIDNTL